MSVASSLRTGLFGMAFSVSRARRTRRWTEIFLRVVSGLQMLLAPLQVGRSASSSLRASFITTDRADEAYSPLAFRVIFVLSLSWTAVFLALALTVAVSFARDVPQNSFILRSLSRTARLSTSYLFLPFTAVLVRSFACPPEYHGWMGTGWDCTGAPRVAVAALTALLLGAFTFLALFVAATFIDRNPSSPSWSARSHGRVDIALLVMKFVLVVLLNGIDPEDRQGLVVAGVLVLIGTLWAFLSFRFMPFVHPHLNALETGFGVTFLWLSVAFVATNALLDHHEDTPSTAIFLGAVLAFALGAAASLLRESRIAHEDVHAALAAHTFSPHEVEVWARHHLRALADSARQSALAPGRAEDPREKDEGPPPVMTYGLLEARSVNPDAPGSLLYRGRPAPAANRARGASVEAHSMAPRSMAAFPQDDHAPPADLELSPPHPPPGHPVVDFAGDRPPRGCAPMAGFSVHVAPYLPPSSATPGGSPRPSARSTASAASAESAANSAPSSWAASAQRSQRRLLEETEAAYRASIASFQNDPLAFLFASCFFREHSAFHFDETFALARAKKLNPALDVQYYVYERTRYLREVDDHNASMSTVDRILFDQQVKRTKQLRTEAFRHLVHIWDLFSAPSPDLSRLQDQSVSLFRALTETDHLFRTLLRTNPDSVSVLRAYSTHLEELGNEPSRALELRNKADRVDEANSKQRNRLVRHITFGAISSAQDNPIDERAAVVTISGDPSNLGEILAVSPMVCHTFGFAASQLVGQNMSVIVPPPIRSHHTSFIERFVRTGRTSKVNRSRVLFGMKRTGVLFPIWLRLMEAPPDEETCSPRFTAVMSPVFTDENHMFVGMHESGFRLFAASEGSLTLLGLEAEHVLDDNVSLLPWFPTLAPTFRAGRQRFSATQAGILRKIPSVADLLQPVAAVNRRATFGRLPLHVAERVAVTGDQPVDVTAPVPPLLSAITTSLIPVQGAGTGTRFILGRVQHVRFGSMEPFFILSWHHLPPEIVGDESAVADGSEASSTGKDEVEPWSDDEDLHHVQSRSRAREKWSKGTTASAASAAASAASAAAVSNSSASSTMDDADVGESSACASPDPRSPSLSDHRPSVLHRFSTPPRSPSASKLTPPLASVAAGALLPHLLTEPLPFVRAVVPTQSVSGRTLGWPQEPTPNAVEAEVVGFRLDERSPSPSPTPSARTRLLQGGASPEDAGISSPASRAPASTLASNSSTSSPQTGSSLLSPAGSLAVRVRPDPFAPSRQSALLPRIGSHPQSSTPLSPTLARIAENASSAPSAVPRTTPEADNVPRTRSDHDTTPRRGAPARSASPLASIRAPHSPHHESPGVPSVGRSPSSETRAHVRHHTSTEGRRGHPPPFSLANPPGSYGAAEVSSSQDVSHNRPRTGAATHGPAAAEAPCSRLTAHMRGIVHASVDRVEPEVRLARWTFGSLIGGVLLLLLAVVLFASLALGNTSTMMRGLWLAGNRMLVFQAGIINVRQMTAINFGLTLFGTANESLSELDRNADVLQAHTDELNRFGPEYGEAGHAFDTASMARMVDVDPRGRVVRSFELTLSEMSALAALRFARLAHEANVSAITEAHPDVQSLYANRNTILDACNSSLLWRVTDLGDSFKDLEVAVFVTGSIFFVLTVVAASIVLLRSVKGLEARAHRVFRALLFVPTTRARRFQQHWATKLRVALADNHESVIDGFTSSGSDNDDDRTDSRLDMTQLALGLDLQSTPALRPLGAGESPDFTRSPSHMVESRRRSQSDATNISGARSVRWGRSEHSRSTVMPSTLRVFHTSSRWSVRKLLQLLLPVFAIFLWLSFLGWFQMLIRNHARSVNHRMVVVQQTESLLVELANTAADVVVAANSTVRAGATASLVELDRQLASHLRLIVHGGRIEFDVGEAAIRVEPLGLGSAASPLFHDDACVVAELEDACRTLEDGVVAQGLLSGMLAVSAITRELLSAIPSPDPETTLLMDPTIVVLLARLHMLEDTHLRFALTAAADILRNEGPETLRSDILTATLVSAVFVVGFLFSAFFFLWPLVDDLASPVRSARELLTHAPDDAIQLYADFRSAVVAVVDELQLGLVSPHDEGDSPSEPV